MTQTPETAADGQGEPAELRSLPREVRHLVHAVDRMRSDWLESGPQRCDELMRRVYEACDAVWERPLSAVSSAGPAPATNRAALRELVAEAVSGAVWEPPGSEAVQTVADAVLAVLPAPLAEVWVVWREDEPAHGYFATEDIAKQATIDCWEEDEPPCPDYSWRRDGPRWELVVGGEHGGVYASRRPVYGAPAAPVLPAGVDRAAVLREAAERYERLLADIGADTEKDPRYWTGVQHVTTGLRHMAGETPPETRADAPDVAAVIVAALQKRAGELSELAEEEMRPGLEERAQEWHEAADVARRAAKATAVAQTGKEAAHACGNCDGIDPDTCFMNPNRPPEQCPAAEFVDYGAQCQEAVGHELHTFEETPAAVAQQPRCDVEFEGGGHCSKAAGHRTLQNQDPHTPTKPTVAYSGKGRVWCITCPRPADEDVPLTVEDVDDWDLCPGCGRHVVDVARAAAPAAVAQPDGDA